MPFLRQQTRLGLFGLLMEFLSKQLFTPAGECSPPFGIGELQFLGSQPKSWVESFRAALLYQFLTSFSVR